MIERNILIVQEKKKYTGTHRKLVTSRQTIKKYPNKTNQKILKYKKNQFEKVNMECFNQIYKSNERNENNGSTKVKN